MNTSRIAIIGAGPAGIYAADLLLKAMRERGRQVSIDIFEQLPAPYGLVRYGVAPDHPRIKGIIKALHEVLTVNESDVRLYGNVHFGSDITLADLREYYHAVIFATGASRDAELQIAGIEAAGSYGAADFVSWFDGHPDVPREWLLDAKQVAVIGNGNVALDVSRMLIKHAEDLLTTEVPGNVYAGLAQNPITELHIFGRRGPMSVKFTPLELRELGEVRDVDMVLDERDFAVIDTHAETLMASNKQLLVLSRIMNQWRERQREREAGVLPAASRKLYFHFWSRPDSVVTADGRVAGLRIERMTPDGAGGVIGTGEYETVPVQSLYRAIGYFSSPLADVPFDNQLGVIPNQDGRVMVDGAQVPGVYATGWVKRGPIGLIGHTKSDAMQTIACLLADEASWWQPKVTEQAAIEKLLTERNVAYTTVAGWNQLDAHERALGEAAGRERIKVVPRDEMVNISRS